MYLKRILTLFFALIVVSMSSVTASARVCSEVFTRHTQSNYAEKAKRLFTSEMSQKIIESMRPMVADTLGDLSSPKINKIETIFSHYMQARLEYLPPEVRSSVWKILNNFTVKSFKPTRFKNNISANAGNVFGRIQIKISMPDYLLGTIIDFAMRAHEMEHIIQIYSIGEGAASQYLMPKYSYDLHAIEAGAMKVEGTFLLLFSKEILDPLEIILSDQSTASHFAKKMLINTYSSQNVDQYLNANWSQGRYSISSIRAKQILNYAIFPGVAIPVVILSHIFGF